MLLFSSTSTKAALLSPTPPAATHVEDSSANEAALPGGSDVDVPVGVEDAAGKEDAGADVEVHCALADEVAQDDGDGPHGPPLKGVLLAALRTQQLLLQRRQLAARHGAGVQLGNPRTRVAVVPAAVKTRLLDLGDGPPVS